MLPGIKALTDINYDMQAFFLMTLNLMYPLSKIIVFFCMQQKI